jgi:hypothetical protein
MAATPASPTCPPALGFEQRGREGQPQRGPVDNAQRNHPSAEAVRHNQKDDDRRREGVAGVDVAVDAVGEEAAGRHAVRVQVDDELDGAAEVRDRLALLANSARELGYEPSTGLAEGLASTWRYFRELS